MNNNPGQDDNINIHNNTPVFEDRIDTKEYNIYAERIRDKVLKKALKTPKRKIKYTELEEERIMRLEQALELEQVLRLERVLNNQELKQALNYIKSKFSNYNSLD